MRSFTTVFVPHFVNLFRLADKKVNINPDPSERERSCHHPVPQSSPARSLPLHTAGIQVQAWIKLVCSGPEFQQRTLLSGAWFAVRDFFCPECGLRAPPRTADQYRQRGAAVGSIHSTKVFRADRGQKLVFSGHSGPAEGAGLEPSGSPAIQTAAAG